MKVLNADSKSIENAIRCGGLAPTKASCMKNILTHLLERKGKLCLEYLRCLSIDEVKAELSQIKGIGPKSVNLSSSYLLLCPFTNENNYHKNLGEWDQILMESITV